MFRISSLTGSSTILQSIDLADKNEVDESGGNETNLSNPSASTRFTKAGYLTSKGAKKGNSNIKKDVKTARSSDYLIPAAKKPLNTYGTRLHKRLSFNTLIWNGISGLKLIYQAMPLVES